MAKTRKSLDCRKPRQTKVHIDNHQSALPIDKRAMTNYVRSILSFLQVSCDELSIYFTTPKKISDLHNQFFQDPTPTDCITFPIDASYLGEIFVCPAIAVAYAKKHGIDPQKETLLYVIHGILHLAGYDDMDPESKKKMRAMEKKCIHRLT